MIIKHAARARRVLVPLAVTTTFAITATGAGAQTVNAQPEQSANWAGYVAHSKSGQSFSRVSGSWTQPSVSSGSGDGYSAFWVGIGGASNQSQALEQIGTSAETSNGQVSYYAWYELVPAAQQRLNLAVSPGDHISASVAVNGSNVTVSLSNQTTGKSVTKNLQMNNPDVSSAEWIAEAPSAESAGGSLSELPLADFGTVSFSSSSATAGGHTGSISDPDWGIQQVQLNSSAGGGFVGGGGFVPDQSGAVQGDGSATGAASPSDLSSDGSSFTVSSSNDSVSQDTGGSSPYSDNGYGSAAGDGSAGYGYGSSGSDGSGYGYGSGGVDPGYGYDPGAGGFYIVPAD